MTKHDAKLYPGEYFIERRWKPDAQWEFVYRDNDVDVMRTRYDYIVAELAVVGTGVRLISPACEIVAEVVLDKLPVPCEVKP